MLVRVAAATVVLVGCAGAASVPPSDGSKTGAPAAATPTASAPTTGSTASTASAPAPASASASPTPADIFAKLEPDLAACYQRGKSDVPTMTSGRMTLHASIDPAGHATCVVPSDDTGLTLDVETCMRTRLERQTFAPSPAAWSTAVPVVVRDGAVALGDPPKQAPAIETIDSQGLSEDVYDVIGALLPELYACLHGIEPGGLPVIHVGARVGADGHVVCALATAPAAVAPDVRDCTARVLSHAKFRAPKKGYGLLSVPLIVDRRK